MPHCKHCQFEFEEGITVCNDCGRPLEPGPLPVPVEPPPTSNEWVFLKACDNDLEAELLKQILQREGIAVLRKGALRGSYGIAGSASNMPGERIILMVPDIHLGKATRLVQDRLLAGRDAGNMSRQAITERARILRRRRRRKTI